MHKTKVRSRSAPTEQIDTVTLSDLILRDPPDILKLDVEGAKTCVLGVSPAILRRIRVLLIELDFTHNKRRCLFERALAHLQGAGFRVRHNDCHQFHGNCLAKLNTSTGVMVTATRC